MVEKRLEESRAAACPGVVNDARANTYQDSAVRAAQASQDCRLWEDLREQPALRRGPTPQSGGTLVTSQCSPDSAGRMCSSSYRIRDYVPSAPVPLDGDDRKRILILIRVWWGLH